MKYLNDIYNNILLSILNKRSANFLKKYSNIKKKYNNVNKKGNIIVAPFSFDNSHAFEAIYARKAMLEGKTVYGYFCGRGVTHCENKGHYENNNFIRCQICNFQQKCFVSLMNINSFFVNKNITKHDKIVINNYIEKYKSNFKELELFMNIDINKVLYTALQRYYLEAEPELNNNIVTIGFLKAILTIIITFNKLCEKVHPEYVVVSHGTYSSWGSIVEYCKSYNIRVIVWGREYNKYGIYFAENESYLKEKVIDPLCHWQNKLMSSEQKAIIENFFKMRTSQRPVKFLYDYNRNQKKQLSESEIRDMYDIPLGAKIVGMFPNLPWDGSVTGVSETFSSYREWLYTTISFFMENRDFYLLVRTHPAELDPDAGVGEETLKKMIDNFGIDLPKNIIIIPPDGKVNSFALGQAALFGVFYCSTVGMELTYLGLPLICAGPSPLRNKGIVYDAKNKTDYIQLLCDGISNNLIVDEIKMENLIKFSYYIMFSRVMPETLIEFEGPIFKNLFFNNETQLQNNLILDHLFKSIENNDLCIFDQFYLNEYKEGIDE